MKIKRCSKCTLDKETELFFKDKKSADGLQSWCKSCKCSQVNEYYKNNPDKKNSGYSKEHSLKRYYKNRINYNVSRRIRKFFKSDNTEWTLNTILGYTLKQFKNHIECQFDENMNWENHGIFWEIDHKLPLYIFNIQSYDCKDFKICWALSNIRPLEKKANASKGKKIIIN